MIQQLGLFNQTATCIDCGIEFSYELVRGKRHVCDTCKRKAQTARMKSLVLKPGEVSTADRNSLKFFQIHTQREVASMMGVTQQFVQQNERSGLLKLRRALQSLFNEVKTCGESQVISENHCPFCNSSFVTHDGDIFCSCSPDQVEARRQHILKQEQARVSKGLTRTNGVRRRDAARNPEPPAVSTAPIHVAHI